MERERSRETIKRELEAGKQALSSLKANINGNPDQTNVAAWEKQAREVSQELLRLQAELDQL